MRINEGNRGLINLKWNNGNACAREAFEQNYSW